VTREPRMAGAAATPCGCRPLHRGVAVDAGALNAAADALIRAGLHRDSRGEVDCLVVPGYTPRLRLWRRPGLHPLIARTCQVAARDLEAGVAPLVIVSGGAVHGPDNEAMQMREFLLAQGVPAGRILVEPCARHTTTNLRNAGRIMLAHGLRTAYVIACDSDGNGLDWLALRRMRQAAYIGFPRLSGFHLRCRLSLGYRVGQLAWVRPLHVHFVPSSRVLQASPGPTAEGDP
jgi:DUF218 domain-containing protein